MIDPVLNSHNASMPEAAQPVAAKVILASASQARRQILAAAGIAATVQVSGVDEAEIKHALKSESAPPRDIATVLAEIKASRISTRAPDAYVIGADQILVLGDRLFDKAADITEARETLRALRGREHRLVSAVAVASAGQVIWRHVEEARLTMREFSDACLDAYLDAQGEAVLSTVGAYRLDGPGAQLFQRVDGDYFTVLGLPLLPLLAFLRTHGVILR